MDTMFLIKPSDNKVAGRFTQALECISPQAYVFLGTDRSRQFHYSLEQGSNFEVRQIMYANYPCQRHAMGERHSAKFELGYQH